MHNLAISPAHFKIIESRSLGFHRKRDHAVWLSGISFILSIPPAKILLAIHLLRTELNALCSGSPRHRQTDQLLSLAPRLSIATSLACRAVRTGERSTSTLFSVMHWKTGEKSTEGCLGKPNAWNARNDWRSTKFAGSIVGCFCLRLGRATEGVTTSFSC